MAVAGIRIHLHQVVVVEAAAEVEGAEGEVVVVVEVRQTDPTLRVAWALAVSAGSPLESCLSMRNAW